MVAKTLTLASVCFAAGSLLAQSTDLIVRNARIWTGNPKRPFADSMKIAGDVILSVGDSSGEAARTIDARGRLIVPGFVDSHVRLLEGGLHLKSVQLRPVKSRAEFTDRVRKFAATVPEGRWIIGGDWNEANWGGELPSREWIDAAVPKHPVWLQRADGQMGLANSLALRLAGVTARTLPVEGGSIVKDVKGEPTGLLFDNAMEFVQDVVPPPSLGDAAAALVAAMRYLNEEGVTTVHDMGLEEADASIPEADRTVRVYAAAPLSAAKNVRVAVDRDGRGNRWRTVGLLLESLDGSTSTRAAAFDEPYSDAPQEKGFLQSTPEALHDRMIAAQLQGLNMAIHAHGDRANGLLLDVIARIGKVTGPTGARFRIEGAQHLRPADIEKFAKMGVVASMRPLALAEEGPVIEKRVGAERSKFAFAIKSLLDGGATVAFGSGWPSLPANAIEGIHAAVNRHTAGGKHPGGWIPAQKISVEQALRAYTQGGAYAGFEEGFKGTLEAGKLADFAMLDQNLFEIPPARIRETKVLLTVVGGRIVYERK